MNIKKNLQITRYAYLIATCFIIMSIVAKRVDFFDDAYLQQAPQDIVAITERAAHIVGFDGTYEVAVPKNQAAVAINPWNKFIASGVNPSSHYFVIIANPAWVTTLSPAEQDFLFARCFVQFQEGMVPWIVNYFPYLFFIIGIFIFLAIFYLLGKTTIVHRSRFLRIAVAFGISLPLNMVMDYAQVKFTRYLAERHDVVINQKAPEYTFIAFEQSDKHVDAALLMRTNRFNIEKSDYFWLSKKPFKRGLPEKFYWDAHDHNIVTYAIVYDQITHKKLAVFCTHFDSRGLQSRIHSARIIRNLQQKLAPNIATIIAGDFNTHKDAEKTYDLLTENNILRDIRDFAQSKHYGPDGTWIGWSYDRFATTVGGSENKRMDHIFVRQCLVLQEGVLNLKVNDQHNKLITSSDPAYAIAPYPSDHLPVIADVEI